MHAHRFPRFHFLLAAALTASLLAVAPGPASAGAPRGGGGLVIGFGDRGTAVVPLAPRVARPGQHVSAVIPAPGGRLRIVSTGDYPSPDGEQHAGFVAVNGYLGTGRPDPAYNKGRPRVIDGLFWGTDDSTTLAAVGIDAGARVYLLIASQQAGWTSDGRILRLGAAGVPDGRYSVQLPGPLPAGFGEERYAAGDYDLAVLADGSTRACFESRTSGTFTYVTAYTPTGQLQETFGTGEVPGYARLPSSDGWRCHAMTMDNEGRVYLAGSSQSSSPSGPAVATVGRLTAAGAVDASWGSHGLAVVPAPGASPTVPWTLRVAASGDVYVGGYEQANGVDLPCLARLLPTGILDPSFGTGGVRAYGLPGRIVTALSLEDDGRIYLSFNDLADYGKVAASVLRVSGANGAVDASWAHAGAVAYPLADRDVAAVALSSTRVLVAMTRVRSAGMWGPVVEERTA